VLFKFLFFTIFALLNSQYTQLSKCADGSRIKRSKRTNWYRGKATTINFEICE